MISAVSPGTFRKTLDALSRMANRRSIYPTLERYGRIGVSALASATPTDTGLTSRSWGYNIIKGRSVGIEWFNTNVTDGGTPVAILLQYGHGTGTGGYVQGQDFINPAIRPIFDDIADAVWKEVNS